MNWKAFLLFLLALLAATAGSAHFASAERTDGVSYVRSVGLEGNNMSTEFTVPVEVVYATNTGSMRPAFDDDVLVVAQPKNLAAGDIVVYENGGNHIVHRIVGINFSDGQTFYRLKGDNNFWDDGLFPESAIKWKVIGILY